MRIISALAVICFLFVILSGAEGCKKDPYIPVSDAFYKTYSETGNLTGRSILKNGNGFMVCGFGTNTVNNDDFYLLSVDSMGNKLDHHFAGTAGNDQCWSFVNANDGGYLIAGWTDLNDPGVSNDVLIVKTDADGNLLWSKTYGGVYNDLATHVIAVSNGYLVTAIKGADADENSWILRLDNNGDTLWTFTYGGHSSDGAMNVCFNENGTYAITGYTNSGGNGSTDGYVLIMNDQGAMLHYWPFGTPQYEEPHCIEAVPDGWVISGHAGTTDIHTHNVFLQFISTNGTMGKFLMYGDHEHDGAEDMMVFHNRIYIAARSASRDPLQDPFYIETDIEGNQLVKQWTGSSQEDPAFGLYVDDFQQLMTGYSLDPVSGRKHLFLLRR